VLASVEAAAVTAARESGERRTNKQGVSLTFEVSFEDSSVGAGSAPNARPAEWKPVVCCTCILDPFGGKHCTGSCC